MLHPTLPVRRRHGVATIEMAVLLVPLFTLLIGVWEMGRIIQMEQLLLGATREAARQAAQGMVVKTTGAFVTVYTTTPGTPPANVIPVYLDETVKDFLQASTVLTSGTLNPNLNTTNVKTEFYFLNPDNSFDLSRPDPYLGQKGDRFLVRVTLPVADFGWTNTSLLFRPAFMQGFDNLSAEMIWYSLMDDPFTLDTSVPGWNGP